MKSKGLLLTGLFAIGLGTYGTQAADLHFISTPINISEATKLPIGYEQVALHGDLLTGIGPNAIEAGISDDDIYIGFNQSFGNVSISIYNSLGGLVYSTVVNTDVQPIVIIPFSSAASGSYYVELNNANGEADGEFEKD